MIEKRPFGTLPDGRAVTEYLLSNKNGMRVGILDFGGTIKELYVPDRNGKSARVVQGFDSLDDYRNDGGYLGALIGRCCNRIKKGKFTLEGKDYQLFCNHLGNSLHGGKEGFGQKLWLAEPVDGEEPELHLSYVSHDGEEGYPGTLSVKVTYKLLAENALSIHYTAVTDETTLCNLTNHTYFNLGGYDSGTVYSQILWVDADRFLPSDETYLPTGKIVPVEGTPFDFRVAKPIGRDLDPKNPYMLYAGGYDHYLFFTEDKSNQMRLRAYLYDPASGRKMEVYTNQPGLQVYSANMLDNPDRPLSGNLPQKVGIGLCMETAKPIDAINNPSFGSVTLHSGELYDYQTIYRFSVE
ncbi:MAG: galactose mutarotase [Clostridia bacterium]|nr:galactose mutarotase [Clostridia bacterium]